MNFESLNANTDHSKANLFNQYFHSVFHDPSSVPKIDDLPAIHNSLQSITITVADVYQALISLDVNRSAGIGNISPRVLQSCAVALSEPLYHLLLNHSTTLLYQPVGKSTKSCPYSRWAILIVLRTIVLFRYYLLYQKFLKD